MSEDAPRPPTIAERIEELRALYHRELLRPLPYKDCRKIKGDTDGPHQHLIPDLSTYNSNIASKCLGAKKLIARPTDYLLESKRRLSQTFFEQYPQYADLERLVTRAGTPKLYEELEVYERARKLALELVEVVLDSRERSS
ncbi:MAG TPA: YxiJ family protein [Armatimonadota bacterium]|nr:YxiJ family protein [Armatimonadota bacterium]